LRHKKMTPTISNQIMQNMTVLKDVPITGIVLYLIILAVVVTISVMCWVQFNENGQSFYRVSKKLFKRAKLKDNRTMAKLKKPVTEVASVESTQVSQVETQDEPVVTKAVCPRCKGDGVFHSTKTGYRAKTSAEPLIDTSRPCPDCGGKK